jgi:UDP-4-amino-4,6-dideoxy-N-acetyl-beta-L-altrosamine N-acetyltransferase
MKDIELILVQEDHIETIRDWRNSEQVKAYMYTDKYITLEDQRKWFESIKGSPKSKYWIISWDKKELGLVSLTNIDTALNSCYWAFYLGDTSVRGAGIGGKVEYKILEYVFENLKLNKLRCEVFAFNEKVIKMHEKFGFRREAYYREHCLKNGKYEDVVGLAILKSEWNQIKDQLYANVYERK